MKKKSLQKIQDVFIRLFGHIPLKIPEDDLVQRRKGSMPFGSGRIFYIFDEEAGREYFEYYTHHRIGGEGHGKIYDDGECLDLPTLETMIVYNPNIPGDEKREQAENEENYRKTLADLTTKGMFDSEPMPGSLAMNIHIMTQASKKGKRLDGD